MVWPSAAMRLTKSGSVSKKLPTRKKVAFTPCFFRASKMGAVLPFSYPASKVRYSTFSWVSRR